MVCLKLSALAGLRVVIVGVVPCCPAFGLVVKGPYLNACAVFPGLVHPLLGYAFGLFGFLPFSGGFECGAIPDSHDFAKQAAREGGDEIAVDDAAILAAAFRRNAAQAKERNR